MCGVMEEPAAPPRDPRDVTPSDGETPVHPTLNVHALITANNRCMCILAAGSIGAVQRLGGCSLGRRAGVFVTNVA